MSPGKILYVVAERDVSTWTIEADGSNPNQLIKEGHYPTVSPDHRFIVYRERIGSELALLRLDLNDGSKKLVTLGLIRFILERLEVGNGQCFQGSSTLPSRLEAFVKVEPVEPKTLIGSR